MVSKSNFPNLHIFNVLADICCKEGCKKLDRNDDLKEILNLTQFLYLWMFIACKGKWNAAEKFLEQMLSKGSIVHAYSYGRLINGYCKLRRIDEALMLLEEMSSSSLVPNIVTYTTLMDGFCKVGRTEDAQKLFAQVQACGQFPNVQIYAVLLDGLCKNQQFPEAIKLLKDMEIGK
nr:putative pentatricopeptide repeat-containing protein At1g12700, mitochondrial [Malus domestica]